MDSLPVDAGREAAMSEELSRFWSSMARKFDRGQVLVKYRPTQPLPNDNTWQTLVTPQHTVSIRSSNLITVRCTGIWYTTAYITDYTVRPLTQACLRIWFVQIVTSITETMWFIYCVQYSRWCLGNMMQTSNRVRVLRWGMCLLCTLRRLHRRRRRQTWASCQGRWGTACTCMMMR